MSEILAFQRARKPEEQQLRRDAIIAAAAELFDEGGETAAGLNAIAARAGFTKSNVYRYFESREEVLLNLLFSELEGFVTEFEQAVATCSEDDIAALAAVSANGFLSRPRFSKLLPLISSVLEQNISAEKIIALKRGMLVLNVRLATALQSKLPGTTLDDCAWAAFTAATLVAGMWPMAHPSNEAAKVLALPEFASMKPALPRDLPRAIAALLRSIVP
ncbi:MAG: TetR family transcriptional regulator [Devosia sp.]